jgi:outer membrane receptor for ferrienterochelin and colicins
MKRLFVKLIFVFFFAFPIFSQEEVPDSKKPNTWDDSSQIVVTGTKTPKLLKDSPVPTQVVSRERMEAKGDTSLFEALKGVTGVVPEINCANCNYSGIRLNGLDTQYNQILFNGVPIVSSLAQVYLYQQVPESMIDKIEVVKGGGSTLYGPGAVGGVINIQVRRPKKNSAEFSTQQSYINGSIPMNYSSASGSKVSMNGKHGIYVFGGIKKNNPYFHNEDEFSEINKMDMQNIGVSGFASPFEDTEFSYTLFNTSESRRGGSDYQVEPFQSGITEQLKTINNTGILKWEQKVSSMVSYNLYVSGSSIERESYFGANPNLHYINPSNNTIDWNFFRYANIHQLLNPPAVTNGQADWDGDGLPDEDIGSNAFGRTNGQVGFAGGEFILNFDEYGKLMLGFQEQQEKLQDRQANKNMQYLDHYHRFLNGELIQDPNIDLNTFYRYKGETRQNNRNVGMFTQYEYKLNDIFEIVVGIRKDKHSKLKKEVYSPRAALLYHVTKNLDWRTAYSTGFRAPQVYVEDFHLAVISGEATRIENSPNLKPETSRSYTSSFTYTDKFFDIDMEFLAGGFYTRLYDAFNEEPSTNGVFLRKNTTGAEVYGGELQYKANTRNFHLGLGGTVQKSHYIDPRPVLGDNDLLIVPEENRFFNPANMFSIEVNEQVYSIPFPTKFASRNPYLFNGGTYSKNFSKIPAIYGNIFMGYTLNDWMFSTDVMLFGRQYVPHFAGYTSFDRFEKTEAMIDWSLRVSYKFYRDRDMYYELFAGVKNVMNHYQRDIDKGIFRDVTYFYGPAMPRTYYAGVKGKF